MDNAQNVLGRLKGYVARKVYFQLSKRQAKRLGITFSPPNYIFVNKLGTSSTIVDVGCADDPDFSEFMIDTFGCKSFGVDPTRKHFAALAKVAARYQGKFSHLPYAVANQSGTLTFYESKVNASGSLKQDHTNVKNDEVVAYDVKAVSLPELKVLVGSKIDLLKLDLEGAEYELLQNLQPSDLVDVEQLFVEFHHHCIDSYDIHDTERLVKQIEKLGFKSFTMDRHNYLFYR